MSEYRKTGEFVRLLAENEPQIRGLVMILVPDWHDAQDVMQKVSVVLWRKFGTFRPDTNFLIWAMVVAKLEVKDYWKRKKRERLCFSDDFVDLVAVESESMASELDHRRRVLKVCLDRLKARDRELLTLRYYEGASIDAISTAVGRSCEAVYKALGRVRIALVDCVKFRTIAGDVE